MAGAEIERYKNVHFAGEHTSLDAQGYMEGGALTGAMAAAEVAGDLGISTQKLEGGERRAIWMPEERIFSRARAARAHRRWKTAMARKR
jgi:monoamine oxidase